MSLSLSLSVLLNFFFFELLLVAENLWKILSLQKAKGETSNGVLNMHNSSHLSVSLCVSVCVSVCVRVCVSVRAFVCLFVCVFNVELVQVRNCVIVRELQTPTPCTFPPLQSS